MGRLVGASKPHEYVGPAAVPVSEDDDDGPENPDRPSRLAITGTPGTGKTSATSNLDSAKVVHLNEVIREEELWSQRDQQRGAVEADLDAVRAYLQEWSGIVESHLAHHLAADRVIVLRCHPETLESRLRERGASQAKISENAQSEALDVILSETVSEHGRESVYEVDTTSLTPAEVAEEITAVRQGDRTPSVGTVDFTDYL
ncbi:MAG: putative nucleotide kinase [uncultured archaeon A07HR60]|nr:MAG: putative nucleotide kinase [uncultured archaeon A07HR60]